MSSLRRLVMALAVALVVAMAVSAGVAPVGAASSSAARPPVVTSLTVVEGPRSGGTQTVLKGRGLKAVRAVRFGTKRAKLLKRSGTALRVRVPSPGRAKGAVKVWVQYGGAWRATGQKYRYVAKPSISRLSTSTGLVMGGERLTISGKALDRVTRVVLSGSTARIVSRKSTSLTILTPPSVAGVTNLSVSSAGGTATKTFTYRTPAPMSRGQITPVESTFEAAAAQIQWVTRSESSESYLVSLAPDATLPPVGAPFFLPSGSAVYPTGLAGKVESLAVQEDGSFRVVVASVPLDQVFSALDVTVTDRIDPTTPALGNARAAAPSGSLGKAFSSAFDCEGGRDFGGSLEIKISDLTPYFETHGFGNPFSENKVSAYISGTTEVSGSIQAESGLECDLNSEWQNSHRKVVSLGYGVTYSIAPEVHLSVSAAGGVTITRSQTFLYGVHWTEDHGMQKVQDTGTPQVSVEGQLAGSVSLEGGVSNRLGLLDRIGIEVEGLLYMSGQASFTAGATGKFCLSASYGLKAPVKLFLDYWVDEETASLFTIVLEFGSLSKCGRVWGMPDSTDPQISTARLPDATVGSPYEGWLESSDGRAGTWRTSSPLPPGLTLTEDGSVTGTPTSGVGSRILSVTFEDSAGKLATAAVSLTVVPSAGLGGGDIQATLTWSHAADMDLHALEPDGNEIYYSNPTSSTGGELDHDSNVGCGDSSHVAENIRWPAGAAPAGSYYFRVNTYSECGVEVPEWQLEVRVAGRLVLQRSGVGTSEWFEVPYGTGLQGPRAGSLPPLSRDPKA
ncbi:IPT/TIG domain-containing protein [Nocardioides sp. cx-169]|uniref:IPT/TIG domain-containing protein n=1 Tax=Nocardioides sp. cx-169 TaxID=2899080 RepID=UPI001E2FC272|nr:IPT/TIG domain-containing protein [Nocardioides sp. cx-169]MCD4534048.1 IPT/TIG domain-containing protein [Nocardioides sp. cx-169]